MVMMLRSWHPGGCEIALAKSPGQLNSSFGAPAFTSSEAKHLPCYITSGSRTSRRGTWKMSAASGQRGRGTYRAKHSVVLKDTQKYAGVDAQQPHATLDNRVSSTRAVLDHTKLAEYIPDSEDLDHDALAAPIERANADIPLPETIAYTASATSPWANSLAPSRGSSARLLASIRASFAGSIPWNAAT